MPAVSTAAGGAADNEVSTPTNAGAAVSAMAAASPFACCDNDDVCANAIPLKPGGKHIKVRYGFEPYAAWCGAGLVVAGVISTHAAVRHAAAHVQVTNSTKREYVLLKAHKMLVGAVESQMSALIDAFHSLIPRDLLDKYAFSSMEMQLLVCGEQRIDIQDLKRHCK